MMIEIFVKKKKKKKKETKHENKHGQDKYLNVWHAFDSTELFLKKFQKSVRSILNY